MTVSTATRDPVTFLGSGSTGPFVFGYRVIAKTDIEVTKVAADGTRTTLTEAGGDFTATLVDGGLSGVSITTTDAVASGETLVIEGNTPIKQEVDYANQGEFFPETHETSYDRLTLISQELNERQDRSLRMVPETSLSEILVDDPAAGAFLKWNAAADGITNSDISTISLSNFVGRWSDQTGAATVPTAVAHNNKVWILLSDVADITADEPGVTANWQSVTFVSSSIWGGTATGTGDAIVITPSPAIDGYNAGQVFTFLASADNTTTATVNVNSKGAKTIKKQDGSNLSADDIVSGELVTLVYDGTNMVLANGNPTRLTATLDCAENTVSGGVMVDNEYNDSSSNAYDLGNISGAVTVDYTNGHYQYGTLTGNITSLTVDNWPVTGNYGALVLSLTQDGTGSRTITLSSAYKTPGGVGVTLSTAANARDKLHLETHDAGTTIDASLQAAWS